MPPHPEADELRAAAAGDPEVRARIAGHLGSCAECRGRLAAMASVLAAVVDELGAGRMACPAPEVLAAIPPGAEADDPHVRGCPLCLEELRLIRALESRRAVEGAFARGMPGRSEAFVRRETGYLQAAPAERVELEIGPSAEAAGAVAGAEVRLLVRDAVLVVEVEGAPRRELVLVLESDLLTKRVPLRPGVLEMPAAGWSTATVEAAGGAV